MGKLPAQFSVKNATKRSCVDNGALCITKTSLFSVPESSMNVNPNLSLAAKSNCIVDIDSSLPKSVVNWMSTLGP